MKLREANVLTIAEVVRDAAAMNDAALARDFDEARFLAMLVATNADAAGFQNVALAAASVLERLGREGGSPKNGYGLVMFQLAGVIGQAHGILRPAHR